MAIDFPRSTYTAAEGVSAESWPASPSNGDTETNGAGDDFTFNGTSSLWVLDTGRTLTLSGGATYSWDGEKWIAQSHIPFRYFGPQDADPTGLSADNEGDLYFNTVANEMRVYNGSSWDSLSTVEVLSDTSPQLGGDLDVNNNTITGLPDAPSVDSEASSKKYVDDQIAGLDTDLSYTANTRELASSTGNNVTLPEVVASGDSGLMTGADKNKLDNVATSANNYTHPNHGGDVTSVGDGNITINNDAVTYAKMQNLGTANRVLGGTATGDISEVQVATDMIANDAVTSAKLEHDITLPGTGAVIVPAGATDARPDPATNGMIRYNSTNNQFEGRINGAWGGIGGGATGGGSDAIFIENGQNVTQDYTITANTNAGSFGPITIDAGVTVTVPASSNWTIV